MLVSTCGSRMVYSVFSVMKEHVAQCVFNRFCTVMSQTQKILVSRIYSVLVLVIFMGFVNSNKNNLKLSRLFL